MFWNEYRYLYSIATHLWDSTLELFKVVHVPSLGGSEARSLALCAASQFKQLITLYDRLQSIRQQCDPNAVLRTIAATKEHHVVDTGLPLTAAAKAN